MSQEWDAFTGGIFIGLVVGMALTVTLASYAPAASRLVSYLPNGNEGTIIVEWRRMFGMGWRRETWCLVERHRSAVEPCYRWYREADGVEASDAVAERLNALVAIHQSQERRLEPIYRDHPELRPN